MVEKFEDGKVYVRKGSTKPYEEIIEGQCSNCEETSEHCEFCDIQDLKKITGGKNE